MESSDGIASSGVQDENSYPVLKDLAGTIQEIKPCLGIYINNMHRQIYLDYILSFPVNYKKDIRERIRKSFESGIKKSLPPALWQCVIRNGLSTAK